MSGDCIVCGNVAASQSHDRCDYCSGFAAGWACALEDQGRKGGQAGGVARAKSLSPERRAEIARKAAQTRWGARMRPHQSSEPIDAWRARHWGLPGACPCGDPILLADTEEWPQPLCFDCWWKRAMNLPALTSPGPEAAPERPATCDLPASPSRSMRAHSGANATVTTKETP